MTFLKPMADGPSFLYKKLVQEIGPCVISSRTSFFSYEKLGRIRTLLYSVRETWSHVIEILRRYWLELSRHRSHSSADEVYTLASMPLNGIEWK